MRMRMTKNREIYDINTRVKGVKDYHNILGTIIAVKMIKIPHDLSKEYVLYCIKKTDNHYEWINSLYVRKIEVEQ